MYENYPFSVPGSIHQKIQVETESLHRIYARHWSEKNHGGEPLGLAVLRDWASLLSGQTEVIQEACEHLMGPENNGLVTAVDVLARLLWDFEGLHKLAVETLPFDPVVRAKVLETQRPADGASVDTQEGVVQ